MQISYWERSLRQSLTRRRALASVGGAALGATLLAACGGGSKSQDAGNSNALVTSAVDTTKQAKKGGVFKAGTRTDTTTFDPGPIVTGGAPSNYFYSTLTRVKPGVLARATGEIEGDLAESWEFSPDKLQLTLKLRPNAKWDPRAPTNGRSVEASDVAFSWDRYSKVGGRRQDFVNAANPASPALSLTAVDSRTVVIKFAFLDADVLTLLATNAGGGNLLMIPKEADGGFDPRADIRGSGPYYMSNYVPSGRFEYTRNPNYWDSALPFIDKWDVTIIPEYATSLAQFKAGATYRFGESAGETIRNEDILPTKRDVPQLRMVPTDILSDPGTVTYGFRDGPASQFRDERVRQAFSMSIDRDLWIDTFYNTLQLKSQGLPVTTAWNSALHCHDAGWWLDPKGKDFGPNAIYYQHNVAEAKKLLAAAGYPNGLDTNAHYISTGEYGRQYVNYFEAMRGMGADAGIRTNAVLHNYLIDWGPQVRDAKGNFDGIGFFNASGLSATATYLALFHSSGSLFKGFSADGKSTFIGDSFLDDLTKKMKQEYDLQKRFALAYDLQRYAAKAQYYTRTPGGASGFDLGWPVVGNFQVFRGGNYADQNLWIDPTQAPLKA